MSANPDALTGHLLPPAPPPEPTGEFQCHDCGRCLLEETAWVTQEGLVCLDCGDLLAR